jgi:hypothetical protein
MDIEMFMENLAAEMERLEIEMKSEAFLEELVAQSEGINMSNLAIGAQKGYGSGEWGGLRPEFK